MPLAAQALQFHNILPADEARLKRSQPQLFTHTPSQSEMDEAIRFLMLNGNYESVAFDKQGAEMVITGKPLQVIEEIRFTGIDAFSLSKLQDVIGLKEGERFDRKKASVAAEKVKEFYGESGYYNTVIQLSFPKGHNQNVILNFSIDENAPCRVIGFDLKTTNPILKRRLLGQLSSFLKKPLTEDLLNSSTKRLNEYFIDKHYLTAELSNPQIEYNQDKSGAFIAYEIKDSFRWDFFFSGNHNSSQLEIFRAMDWDNRDRKNVEPASEGADRITRYYLAKGFPQVQVRSDVFTEKSQHLKKVFYTIQEGSRAALQTIEIQGRFSRAPEYYVDFIRNNSSELISHGYYNRQDLDDGLKNLTLTLRNQGYLKARIQSSRIEYDPSKKNVTAFVLLDEGPLTLVQTTDFEGNHQISGFELTEILGLYPSSPLHLTDLESGIERVKEFYHNQGFLEMKILNEGEDIVNYNESGTLARLHFKIYEGPRIRVASVHVDGNSLTKTHVIMREVSLHTGDVLTPKEIENATNRLNRMGLFSRVDIHTLEENTAISERTVIVSVTEMDPGVFRIGGGVNSERDLTARGFTQLSYNNLGGTARAISGRVQLQENIPHVNYLESDMSVSYLEPFVFGSLTRGRVNFTRSQHVFEYWTDPIPLAAISLTNVLTFTLEHDFDRHWRGTWKLWSLEESKDYERNGHCININPSSNQLINPTGYCAPDLLYVATLGPTLDIDYRDSPFNPSRGSLTRIITEYSDPHAGSSNGVQFFHGEAHEYYYIPLKKTSKRWVWANEGRAGYLANLNSSPGTGVPVSHSFFLGGVDTVRGYDKSLDNERIPPGWEMPITEGNQILVTSDSHYYLAKSELRFPITGEHGGVLFYDGGAVFVSGYSFDHPYRDSFGIGYRYNTPVGPVSLDLAFKLHRYTTPLGPEAPFKIHFSIGSF